MRVHIVSHNVSSGRILARLVSELKSLTGWSVGDHPNPRADLNYFFPYLWYDDFHATPTAAWFTHRDEAVAGKPETWDRVAKAVDLRVVCAQMYANQLKQFGPTHLVTPPLDRAKFSPAQAVKHDKPVVGTSGWTYAGGRKGEALIKRLMDSPLESKINLVAAGRDWPCPTTGYHWDAMQTFYQGLDLYICTSTIEGIGYGPLEALSCGIPVVIPRGVGIFDELPDVQNLRRYQAGDFDDLCKAIEVALAEPVNHESLRGITARFTSEAWQRTHLAAFEDILVGAPPIGKLPPWKGKAGVYCVAYRGPARTCAKRLIHSIHTHMPGLPVALASSEPGCGEDIFINNPDEDVGARSVKTKIFDLAPQAWDYVLYLDADTELTGGIGFLFDLLVDGWELVFCTNPAHYVIGREMSRPDNGAECQETFKAIGTDEFLQFNGGVFAFRRNERTKKFFSEWHTEWLRWAKRDQAALDRALYTHPLRVYTLNGVWNCITRYPDVKPEDAVILHYPMQARSWKGVIAGRLDSSEAWASIHPSK
jgi:hypothetical protein